MKGMRLIRTFLMTVALLGCAWAQEAYFGVYLKGVKIGYTSIIEAEESLSGRALKRSDSSNVFGGKMLGSAFSLRMDSSSWSDATGNLVKMTFRQESAGRVQQVEAKVEPGKVFLEINNSGTKSKRELAIPAGAILTESPTESLGDLQSLKAGQKKDFLILDPTTVSLVKNSVVARGRQKVSVRGAEFVAMQIDVVDPRATTKMFLDAGGAVIKMEGPLGMEMFPEPKDIALKLDGEATVDLAFETSIKPDRAIERPESTTALDLEIRGVDFARAPRDERQQISTKDGVTTLSLRAPSASKSLTIKKAAADHESWIKPDTTIPSNQPRFKTLAKRIVGTETNAARASEKIRAYVHRTILPNTSVAMLRDANEVLDSKEGLCRDYTALTATLMRAAGIPCRLISGVMYVDGAFFYHAWVEAWTGQAWMPYDATLAENQIGANRIKLAQGRFEDAYLFFVLDSAKIKVVNVRYRSSLNK